MNYMVYLLLSITAACAAAAVCLGALWLLAPALTARAQGKAYRGWQPFQAEPEEEPARERAPGPGAAPEEAHITFDVRREQLPMLAGMLRKETPDNIAIVLSRLPAAYRPELLALLDKELAQQALVSLAAVRFVDKEMLLVLKSEIEKRIDGVIGGLDEAVALLAPLTYSERKEFVRRLEAGDPQLAYEARSRIILEDDLLSLSDKDAAAAAAALPPEEFAEVYHSLPDKLRTKLRDQLSVKGLELAEKAAPAHAQPRKKKDEDMDKFMAAVVGLVASGRLAKPAVHMKHPAAAKPRGEADW